MNYRNAKRKTGYRRKKPTRSYRKQVRKLIRKIARKTEPMWFSLGYVDENAGSASSPKVIPLSDFSSLTPRFGTETDDCTDASAIYKSINMHIRLTLENLSGSNEEETTTFTVFLVSVKDVAKSVIDSSTGQLTTLVDGQHMYNVEGNVYLNTKVFNIHKMKRLTLTNHGTLLTAPSAQSQYGVAQEWSWKIRPNKKVTAPGYGGINDWKEMKSGDPSSTYFLIIFSDNSSVDTENPCFTANIIERFDKI